MTGARSSGGPPWLTQSGTGGREGWGHGRWEKQPDQVKKLYFSPKTHGKQGRGSGLITPTFSHCHKLLLATVCSGDRLRGEGDSEDLDTEVSKAVRHEVCKVPLGGERNTTKLLFLFPLYPKQRDGALNCSRIYRLTLMSIFGLYVTCDSRDHTERHAAQPLSLLLAF